MIMPIIIARGRAKETWFIKGPSTEAIINYVKTCLGWSSAVFLSPVDKSDYSGECVIVPMSSEYVLALETAKKLSRKRGRKKNVSLRNR